MISLNGQGINATYSYSGMGDRLRQTMNGQTTTYALDLNSGLTQVLNDGTNTYTYGLGRIAQAEGTTTEYFLGDALGSVRQLTNTSGEVTLTKSYAPYGETLSSAESATSPFAYTSEQVDASGLVYLRARYYAPQQGRFPSSDTWGGNINQPLSLNQWNYVNGNPINYSDPSGHCAGYRGINAPINTVMLATVPTMQNWNSLMAVENAWQEFLTTCVDSLQKAGTAFNRSDYIRAYLYALGFAASSHQAAERIGQINHEMDIIWCEDASLGDKLLAGLDIGLWSVGIASFIVSAGYAIKRAVSEAYLVGLG